MAPTRFRRAIFFREFMVDYYKAHGSVPMWNPYIFCGMPFVDAFHGDIFYLPTFILKMILPLTRALGWGLILHIYLAGIFAYICARGFGLSRVASAFAGVSYMFAGYLVSLVAPGHDGKIFVTTLFPLAFHFLNRGTATFKLKWFLLLGLTIALIILTPHPQMAYFTLWGLGGFFLYRLVFMLRDKVGNVKAALSAAMFVLAILIGLFGSAIQFYPGYKYIQEFSPRAGDGAEGRSGYEWATSWSMHLEELVGQFIPFFAGVDDRKAEGGYWGRNSFKDNTEYTGFFPLFLGVIGIALWRRRETWFLLGMAAFALIYALGGTTPFFYIFYAVIPNVSKMRAPSMIMFLFSFSFAMLAAFGIDALIKLRHEVESQDNSETQQGLDDRGDRYFRIGASVYRCRETIDVGLYFDFLFRYSCRQCAHDGRQPPDGRHQSLGNRRPLLGRDVPDSGLCRRHGGKNRALWSDFR